MGVRVNELEIKIDGKKRNRVLGRYKDDDGDSFNDSFDNGYYPSFKDDRNYNDKYIVGLLMKDFPKSEIFFRIVTDYGEEAYSAKNGRIRRLQKRWV